MIPNFPNFKHVEIIDKSDVEKFTHSFKPYSDFNFISLFAWDTSNQRKISILNGNLVVLFTDYATCESLISFLGKNKVEETILQLLNYTENKNLKRELLFISEESVTSIINPLISIVADYNNFDYIFSVFELATLQGSQLKSKRRYAKKFVEKNLEITFNVENLNSPNVKKIILSLLAQWEKNKQLDGKEYDLDHEKEAIMRLINEKIEDSLIFSYIATSNGVVGFSIDELLPDNFVMSHFFKTDITFEGSSEYLNMQLAKYLLGKGALYWNWEQDLGYENLKASKLSYTPISYLKKYKIT